MSSLLDVSDPTVFGTFKLKRWSLTLPIPLWMNDGPEINLWNVDFRVSINQAIFPEHTDEADRLAVLENNVREHATDRCTRRRGEVVHFGYRFAAQGARPVVQSYFLHGRKLLDVRMIFQLEKYLALANTIAESVTPVLPIENL